MKKTTYRLMSVLVSLALAMGWSASADARAAKAVYVDSNGSDSNIGSASSPFKTLSKGVSVLVAGDTLYVSGTFNMPLTISKPGTVSAPITVVGTGAILDMNNAQAVGVDISGDYVNVSGFEVIGAVSHGVLISGKHIRFESSSVHNNLSGSAGAGCNSNVSWGSGVKIIVGADDVLVKGNRVYQNCGEGIGVTRGVNVIVEDNTVWDNYSVNIYIDNSHHVEVIGNTSYCGDRNYLRSDNTFAFGILLGIEQYNGWGNQLHDVAIDSNVIGSCRPIRLYSQFGEVSPVNITISNNLFYGVAEPYVSVAGATVINNVWADYTATPPADLGTATPELALMPVKTLIVPTVSTGINSVDVRVTGGTDDAEESAIGWVYLDSGDLELVNDANTQTVGLRFNGVNIPGNATILNAYVQFTADAASANAATLTIQGEKSPNAVAFTATTRNLSLRARTVAAVNWTPLSWLNAGAKDTDQKTPNMAPVIQEIVNQTGWVSGNSIAVIITGSGKRVAKSHEGDAAAAPLLHIEYTIDTALSQPPETVAPISSPIPACASIVVLLLVCFYIIGNKRARSGVVPDAGGAMKR